MATLHELSEMILDTTAALARMEQEMASAPKSRSLVLTVSSLEQRRQALEQTFEETAHGLGVDVCSYRIFAEDAQPSAVSVARALETFQAWVSLVYGAIKQKAPRRSWNLPADLVQATCFSFGYAFPGSVGFALTLPNERLLMGESTLDESIQLTFQMARSQTPAEIAEYAERVGPVPVRAMYRWTKALVSSGIGADIQWRRESLSSNRGLLIQVPELEHLKTTIEATSDAKRETVTLSGMLVGFHSERGTFDLHLEGRARIFGRLSENLNLAEPARVPYRYSAKMTKITQTNYSTDTDEVTWMLDALTPV